LAIIEKGQLVTLRPFSLIYIESAWGKFNSLVPSKMKVFAYNKNRNVRGTLK
jgi:hypothetical protein